MPTHRRDHRSGRGERLHGALTALWLGLGRLLVQEGAMTDPTRLPHAGPRSRTSGAAALFVALIVGVSPAPAGTSVAGGLVQALEPFATLWSPGMHSGVRLLDGGADPDQPGMRLAGLEIRLDPHFKTYWRTPGDSGLPPVLDWSESRNLRSVEIVWPAPTRFEDQAGSSIGYKDRLVLPLRVTPENVAQPVVLDLRIDYAVCEKVCIPAHGEAKLKLGTARASTPQSPAVEEALAQAPVPQPLTDRATPGVRSVVAVGEDRALVIVAQVPDTKGLVDIFAEGPEGWTFSAPLAVSADVLADGARLVTYRVTVDSKPTGGRLAGLPLRLTMIAGDQAVETVASLDAAAPPH